MRVPIVCLDVQLPLASGVDRLNQGSDAVSYIGIAEGHTMKAPGRQQVSHSA